MPSPHRQLQKAIRIRQYQEGEPNNEGGAGVVFGLPYRDAVLADEPVFAYAIGNGNGTANQLVNQAYRTADPTNTATASSDVYEHPTLDGNNHTSNHKCLYFDADTTTGRPRVEVPWFTERAVTPSMSFECLFKSEVATSTALYSSHTAPSANNGWRVGVADDQVALRYWVSSTEYNIVFTGNVGDIAVGEVHHVVITIDNQVGGNVVCYVDGVQFQSTLTLPVAIGTDALETGYIGALKATGGSAGTDNFYFNGAIQAVCQYDKILTQADVTRHYDGLNKNRFNLTPAYYTTTAWVQNFIPPEGFWRFNGQETGASYVVGDDSGNGNTATRVNDVQAATTSLWHGGKGALFLPKATNDVAHVTIPYSTTTRHTGESSVYATISPTRNTNDEDWINNKIFSVGDMGVSTEQQYGWQLTSNGSLTIRYYIDAATSIGVQSTVPIPNFVADGSTTYEVAMTVSEANNEIKFYVDGEQLGDTRVFNDTIRSRTAGSSYIGIYGSGVFGEDGFHGFIDNVGFWQKVLTPTEIRTMYSLPGNINVLGGVLDNYVARWSFDPLVTTTTTPPTDYTAYYRFNSNLIGSAGGEPTLAGTAPTYEAGLFGNAARFDGVSQGVSTATTTLFERQTFSISVWYKPDNPQPAFVEEIANCYVQRNDTTAIIYGWKLYHSSGGGSGRGAYALAAYDGTSTSSTVWSIGDAGLTANANGWAHLVATVEDGVSAKLYVNGKLVDEEITPANIVYDSEVEFSVGRRWRGNSTAGFLEGVVDELKFYPDVLTADEVAALYLDGNIVENNQQDGYALQGQLVNAPTRANGYDEVVNGAYSFNGTNQYIALLDDGNTDLEPTGAFTVTGWVKSNGTRVDILSNYDNSVRSSGFSTSSRSFVVGQDSGGVDGTDFEVLIHNLADLTEDGNWHHIACEYTGSSLKYYIDGVVVQTDATTVTPVYSSLTEPRIAGTKAISEAFANGELDDVRLYNSAIGEAQIYYLSKLRNPPLPLNESYYWKFDGNVTDTKRQTDWLVFGTPTYPTDGWNSNCISFDNTEYLYLDSTAFDKQTFSVSGFVRRRTETTTTQATVMSNYAEASNANLDKSGWFITADNGNGVMGAQVWDGNGVGRSITTPQGTSLVNKWMHVCLTIDEVEGYKFYVDGNLEATNESVITIGYDNAVGGVNTLYNFNFGGTPVYQSINDIDVDDLRFFSRAITAEEVKTLALRGSAGATVDPETPPPPPTYDPLVLDIDVASITEQVANGTGISYTSQTLTATVTGGSGQFDFAWTTDEPRLVFILGADGFDQSATVNTNAFNILNGSQETVSGTITCTVTDTGNGNATTNDTCTVNITFGTTNDYIAYWNGDSSSVTGFVMADQTTNNHDATFVATPTFGTGVDGNSVLTDTGQYADVTDDAALKTTSFSFACWMKPSATNNVGTLINNGVNLGSLNHQGMYVTYANASDQLTALLGLGTGSVQGTDFESASSIGTITEGDWNHVCVTYDNAFIKLYVNGVERANVAWANGIAWPQANNIRLGAQNLGSPAFSGFAEFDGELDEMKWWDRRLTAAEVSEVYNLEGTPSAPPAPFEVTISPSGISDVIFPIAPYTSQTITATPANGSGSYTYQWAYTSQQSANFVIDNPTSATTTISSTGESAGEYIDTLQVTVTDTGNGNVQVTDSITVFTNWGAV